MSANCAVGLDRLNDPDPIIYLGFQIDCLFIQKQKVKAECQIRTPKCECRFTSRGKEGRDSYSVQVDCYNKSLTSLPKELPDFTDELDVSLNAVRLIDNSLNDVENNQSIFRCS